MDRARVGRIKGLWIAVAAFVLSVFLFVSVLVGGAYVLVQRGADLRTSQRETCERSNDARAASVTEKRHDLSTLRSQVRLWEVFRDLLPPDVPTPFTDALDQNIASIRAGIFYKRQGIEEAIASQADVAIRPDSPIADCDKTA